MRRRRVTIGGRPAVAYRGARLADDNSAHVVAVTATGERVLDPRLDLFNHSPDGFGYGYSGSGPAQLALAILADATGSDERAIRLHQAFKEAVIARLPQFEPWRIDADAVRALATMLEEQGGQAAADAVGRLIT